MTLEEAKQLALLLMEKHGLIKKGWTFRFSKTYTFAGECYFSDKTIRLSLHFIPINYDDELENILLHEIAHALAGSKAGHGKKWKKVCIKIGAKPERIFNGRTPDPNFITICPKCGEQNRYYRKPSDTLVCSFCTKGVSDWDLQFLDASYKLIIEKVN